MAKTDLLIQKRIKQAFEQLEKQAGFETRPVQYAMAQFTANCILQRVHGLIEAPTGVGKSLGALIPALAWAITEGKRVIVATYTNVLAEQYWQKDLPLALQLFGEPAESLKTELVMGKHRYACLDLIAGQGLAGMPDAVHRLMRSGSPVRCGERRTNLPPICAGSVFRSASRARFGKRFTCRRFAARGFALTMTAASISEHAGPLHAPKSLSRTTP